MQNRKQVNLERITQIEQKLNAISQARATNTKEQTYEKVVKKINEIDRNINQQMKNEENLIREMKENLKLFERRHQENEGRKSFYRQNRMAEMQKIKKKLVNFLASDIHKEANEGENKIHQYFQTRIQELNLSFKRQIQKRKLYFHQLDQQFHNDLPQFNSKIQENIVESNRRLKSLQHEIRMQGEMMRGKVEEMQEKQEKSFEQFMKMMSSVISQIKGELEVEKSEREGSKGKLVELFEDTYRKITTF